MEATYKQCAKKILSCMGGRENIISIYHCMTRLRLVVKNLSIISLEKIDCIDGVKGSYIRDGQLHIILGVGTVNKVYDQLLLIGHMNPATRTELDEEIEKRQNYFVRIVKTIGDIFIPILPAMVASGMMMGILLSLVEIAPSVEQNDLYSFLKLMAETGINYLPVLVAFSAAQKFKGNPYLAGALALMLVHRDLFNSWSVDGNAIDSWTIWGIRIFKVSYEGHVAPIIIAVYGMSKLEQLCRRHLADIADFFLTPLITLSVSAIVTFAAIGPIMRLIEEVGIHIAERLLNLPYGVGSAICGGFYPLTIVFGIQHVFMVLESQLLNETKRNIWIRVVSSANFAMCISCLTVFLKTKSARLKSIAFPAGLSAALGVTEPAIFGVNFRYHTPFFCAMIGSAVGSGIGAILNVYGTAYGVSALPGYIITSPCLWQYSVMLLVTAVVTFSLTYSLWKDEKHLSKEELKPPPKPQDETSVQFNRCVFSPIQGTVIKREEIPDPTFAGGYLGEGFGVIPDNGDVVAPFHGKVITITDKKHAIGLEGPNGLHLLIHIGIDTVNLDGSDFEIFVDMEEEVQRGQKLMHFDLNHLKELGCNLTSGVFVLNSDDYPKLKIKDCKTTSYGDIMIKV